MSNPKMYTCDCGVTWMHGKSGEHQCGPYYRERIVKLEATLASAQQEHTAPGESVDAQKVRNQALEEAANLFPQPYMEYFGSDIQDAIRALQSQSLPSTESTELYYLQDKRSYVGNCPLWWAKDGRGYTTRIDQAHRYTKNEAFGQFLVRETDIPWPCSVVDPHLRPTIDIQDLHKTEYFKSIKQTLDAAIAQKESDK